MLNMARSLQYTETISRQFPALFIILLDQSFSMSERITLPNASGYIQSKADIATAAINQIIYAMIRSAKYDKKGNLKKNAYISVLGYNDSVYQLIPNDRSYIDLPSLEKLTLGTAPMYQPVFNNQTGKYEQVKVLNPIWIKPQATGGTQMANAFIRANEIAYQWFMDPPEPGQGLREKCLPPTIINITDAENNGPVDPISVTHQIRQGGTQQGNILIFNCHFTKELSNPCILPSDVSELVHLDPLAKDMFDMSSPIPETLRETAGEVAYGKQIKPGARCFVYNANAEILIRFLRWGTVRRTEQTAR